MFCHLGHFFCLSWRVCYFKGRSLRCSPGLGNSGPCAVRLYVGEGLRGSNGARLTLLWISVFHSATHNQTGPLWCWFLSGWACARPRPLWVSPTTCPVRLGVSPAAASTPTGAFNQRSEALFPHTGALGYAVFFAPHRSSWFICARVWGCGVLPAALPAPFSATLSPALLVYLCAIVGPQGLLVVRLPAPFVPHSTSLSPASATCVLSALAAHLRPSYWSGYMFLFYLLGVGLPCRCIFCQFWLCEEAQCVYLRCHLGSPFFNSFLKDFFRKEFIYLFFDRGGGKRKGRETSMCGCLPHAPR